MNYVYGDLLSAAERGVVDVIAHQCNCFNTMRRGIAPQIAARFTEAYEADQNTVRGSREKLGSFSFAEVQTMEDSDHIVSVYNLYGQFGWNPHHGDYGTQYPALFSALRKMRDHLDSCSGPPLNIGFPKIGSGLGGGDWDFISAMIEEIFVRGSRHNVLIYQLDNPPV